MIESQLLQQVHHVAALARRLRFRRSLAIGLLLVIAAGLAFLFAGEDGRWSFALAAPALCLGTMAAWFFARLTSSRSDEMLAAARAIEARHPTLSAKLLTALQEIRTSFPDGRGYLQRTVISQAVEHSRQHNWLAAVDGPALRRWSLAAAGAAAALLAMLTTFIIAAEPFASSPAAPVKIVVQPAGTTDNTITVEPGDTAIERGSSLIITARFSRFIPASVSLILEGASPALGDALTVRTVPMNASLEDPLVGARVPAITADLTYRITGQGVESPAYRVTVFDYPQLVQADASLTYPDYTALAARQIEDTRQITAVEGTQVRWSLRLNKPVASAKLIAESGEEITLTAKPGAEPIVQGDITLARSQRYRLSLVDEAGRRNKREVEFVISVLKNRPPDLKLVFPRRDLRVSPIEEALVVAQAWDDFGVKQFGITYSMAGRDMNEVTLAGDLPGKANHEASHLLSFEAMKAVPDELLSYHFWADDVGPDGKVRRTFSDMFFAEVRPFEEIFREGQAPPASEQQQQQQQQQGQQQQIGEGIKEQREIISATWNLIRRETAAQPTSAFKADAQAVREAQEAALERMMKIKEELRDPQSLAHVESVEKHMVQAVTHLAAAADANDPAPLKLALPAEQQAYQALLKLQAREHEVIRAQQQQQRGQQSGQQQAGPSQQQLNELELRNQENRYETQRMAQETQPPENAQQRETRQALNRLRDLARRQQDLNEKLKELDLALKEAQTPQEKEELARQLKRLREQQEEMLRDVDELRNRMEQNQGQGQEQRQAQEQSAQKQNEKQAPQSLRERTEQARDQDAKQQVDEVRQNIREATEALEKGMTSKALTEGTRAERKLEELREEFRRRASGQFAEDVKEMRQEARELAGNQEKLGEKMKQADKQGPRSLRDTGERKQIVEALENQKEKLEGLTDRMRRVTEEAENSEPLLSKQLYDALRNADQQKVDQALDVTRELFDKGFNEEAAAVEPQARKGLDDLKRGVEKAADSVLGDEGEALRRARETLDELAREVEGENQGQAESRQSEKSRQSRGSRGSEKGEGGQDQQAKGNGPDKQGEPSQGNERGEQGGERQAKAGDQKGSEQPGEKQADGQRGRQPGEQNGKQPGEKSGEQPGASSGQAQARRGEQPDQESGGQRGEQNGKGQGKQSGEPSGQPGGPSSRQASRSEGQSPRDGERPAKGDPTLLDQLQTGGAGGGGSGPHGPITGENYRQWSDRLRDVEEMIDDPNLREEVARVRDRAQAMRAEFKRHGKEPQWDDVKKLVADPLAVLRDRLDDELARRDRRKDLVPIDRDPVPGQFTDLVKRYYERLGTGERTE